MSKRRLPGAQCASAADVLAALLNVPRSQGDWAVWSFANADVVAQIRAAVLSKKNIALPTYQLDPIPFGDAETWLSNNQQAHNDFTGALGLPGNDLEHVDLRDQNQLQAWIWLNYWDLSQACTALEIGP